MNFSMNDVSVDLSLNRLLLEGFMDWETLSPAELERYVANNGEAFEYPGEVARNCTWKYEPRFELSRFEAVWGGKVWKAADWKKWLREEMWSKNQKDRGRKYYEAMIGLMERNPLLLGPIIVMLDGDEDEHVAVGDGNHRVAIAFLLEKSHVPVILGTRR